MKKYKSLSKIKKYNSVCLIAHTDPDTDAISSMIVLKRFLHENLKIKTVDMFAPYETIAAECVDLLGDFKLNPKQKKYDVAILMDCPNKSKERIGNYTKLFNNAKLTYMIDHHDSNEHVANYNFVNVTSSTCEIVFDILSEFNYKFSKSDFSLIYSGIITDTNNFTVGAFNKNTFEIVSKCVDSIDSKKIYEHFFSNNNLSNMKTFAKAIENSSLYSNKKILISSISHDEAKKYNITLDDYTGVINRLATTKNVDLVCFINSRNNLYYVSMRAKPCYDVSIIAKKYGGGGHAGASAFNSNDTLENIKKLILKEFKQIIKQNTTKLNLFY